MVAKFTPSFEQMLGVSAASAEGMKAIVGKAGTVSMLYHHLLAFLAILLGGMITDKKIKYTKNNKVMCFLTVEDMTGTMEVIVFPNTYEQFGSKLTEDGKVFLSGRVSLEDERDGKLICEKVIPFEEVPRKLWIRFNTADDYRAGRDDLRRIVEEHGGRDKVVLFIANPRCRKELPPGQGVRADKALVDLLGERFGAANVVVQ
jgi:DNA polymerase-3 subunit alpha